MLMGLRRHAGAIRLGRIADNKICGGQSLPVPRATKVPIMLLWVTQTGSYPSESRGPTPGASSSLMPRAWLPFPPTLGEGPPSLGPGGISVFPAWEAALMSAHLK